MDSTGIFGGLAPYRRVRFVSNLFRINAAGRAGAGRAGVPGVVSQK
jgi:hypothetical protein